MVIQQKIGSVRVKLFAIFIISLIIAAGAFIGFRSMPSQAAGDEIIIDVSQFDGVTPLSGDGWEYLPVVSGEYYRRHLVISKDVTLTGTNTFVDTRALLINNENGSTVTFDNLNYSFNSATSFKISDATKLMLRGNNSISMTHTQNENLGLLKTAFSLTCPSDANFATIEGTGNLYISNTDSDLTSFIGIDSMCQNINIDLDGGSINIDILDGTFEDQSTYHGFYSSYRDSTGVSLTMKNGSLNINIGEAIGSRALRVYGKILFDGGGTINASIKPKENSPGKYYLIESVYEYYPVNSTSGHYNWTASASPTGVPLDKDTSYPAESFINKDATYKYGTFSYKEKPNSPVTFTTISPTNNGPYMKSSDVVVSGEITDVDNDTWTVDFGFLLSTTGTGTPSTWLPCVTATTARTFSCAYTGPTLDSSANWNVVVRVTDSPSNSAAVASTVSKVIKINIDDKAPGSPTRTYLNGYENDTWTNKDVQIKFTPPNIDPGGSGIAGIKYSVNSGSDQDYTDIITISDEGVHRIDAYTYDGAWNISLPSLPAHIKIDKTAPSVSHSVYSGTWIRDNVYEGPLTIQLDAQDEGTIQSGHQWMDISWKDGVVSADDCTFPFAHTGTNPAKTTAPTTSGYHTLCFLTVDNAGNTSPVQTATYYITDLTPELTDSTTGITVENLGSGFTDDQYLVINKLANDSYKFTGGQDTLSIFSIEVCSEFDNECTPIIDWPDKLRIKIPVTEYLKTHEKFALIHIKDTGEQVEHPFKIEDGFMTFETDGLSDWAILGTLKPQGGTLTPPNAGISIHKNILTIICLTIAACSTALIVLNTKAIRASKK